MSALQMGVRGTADRSSPEMHDEVQHCAELGVHGDFAAMDSLLAIDNEIEFGTTTTAATTTLGTVGPTMTTSSSSSSAECEARPMLGDLSFGDISSDEDSDSDDEDGE